MAPNQVIERADLDALFETLARWGYTIVGPTLRDGAIVYDELESTADLPAGLTDEQEAGRYRLRDRDDAALFGYNVGPHSLKQLQLPANRLLYRGRVTERGEVVVAQGPIGDRAPSIAFIGARSCELHARAVLERVLLGATHEDPDERAVADRLFIVAVQCGQAGGTCFCSSMGTGPEVTSGYDIALTELLEADAGRHCFVARAGSERGAEVLAEVPSAPATDGELAAAGAMPARAAAQMGRTLETDGIKELLYRNYEHPRWEEVADRCLTCGNCTMVCPTCFCTTVEDVTDLTGEFVERHQRWDSCFTVDYSHIHGGAVRASAKSRYRQWMTHKLATWFDQFGSSGCVGCGRCITWCPVGIDITEEAAAIREADGARHGDT
jgi:ferredoxin